MLIKELKKKDVKRVWKCLKKTKEIRREKLLYSFYVRLKLRPLTSKQKNILQVIEKELGLKSGVDACGKRRRKSGHNGPFKGPMCSAFYLN